MSNAFAYGVDLGWLSQLEANGVTWLNEKGNVTDPLQLIKEYGIDAIRLRVFVCPPPAFLWKKKNGMECMLGFSDMASVLKMAKRVKQQGFRLMIDFHYSDHFADPEYQDIPEAWQADRYEQLLAKVYQHTKEFMQELANDGIYPEWAQVGNEINPGMLLPQGSVVTNFEQLAGLLNSGYEAVKAVSQDTKVVTHLADGYDEEVFQSFFDQFLITYAGKTDVIGMSYYPYWIKQYGKEKDKDKDTLILLQNNLNAMASRYQKEVMICEVGENENAVEDTYDLLKKVMQAVHSVPESRGIGVFYWEPEANAAVLPDGYHLGATRVVRENVLQFTQAMEAFLPH